MRKQLILITAMATIASGTAQAATMRYDCHAPGSVSTYLDVDTAAKTVMTAEAAGKGGTDFPRQSMCSILKSIVQAGLGDNASKYTDVAQCTVAFGQSAIVSDLISTTPPYDFAMSIVFDMKALTLTSIGRFGSKGAYTLTVPCKQL